MTIQTNGEDLEKTAATRSYEAVSQTSSEEAETLAFAACALKVLAGGLSEETRAEIYGCIQAQRGKTPAPLERQDTFEIISELMDTEEHISNLATNAKNIASRYSTLETTQQI